MLIEDIRHIDEYAGALAAAGWTDVRREGSRMLAVFLKLLTWGSLEPGILVARKPA